MLLCCVARYNMAIDKWQRYICHIVQKRNEKVTCVTFPASRLTPVRVHGAP